MNTKNSTKNKANLLYTLLYAFKKKRVAPTIIIEYNTLQSQSGKAFIFDKTKYFERIDVTGNKLLLYSSDNGFTKNGRLGGVYDLDTFYVSFL